MDKYIDAEKLKAEIKRRIKINQMMLEKDSRPSDYGRVEEGRYILRFIERNLQEQQEQPRTCKTCSLFENNCPFVRGKFIPYPNNGCKDYTAEEVQP